jgi:hypothetical protein
MQGSNQRLRVAKSVLCSSGDKITLPAGSFVKAIRKYYLPRDHEFGDYDERTTVVVYSQYGLVLMSRDDLDWNL